jgi:hypothetical protein
MRDPGAAVVRETGQGEPRRKRVLQLGKCLAFVVTESGRQYRVHAGRWRSGSTEKVLGDVVSITQSNERGGKSWTLTVEPEAVGEIIAGLRRYLAADDAVELDSLFPESSSDAAA